MSEEYEIAKIIEDTPDERFLKYLQFSWDIFKATTEKINLDAFYKTAATNEYSKTAGEATGAAVLAVGAIADVFLPGVGFVPTEFDGFSLFLEKKHKFGMGSFVDFGTTKLSSLKCQHIFRRNILLRCSDKMIILFEVHPTTHFPPSVLNGAILWMFGW